MENFLIMFASLNHKEYSQMRKQAHLKGGQEILCYDESASDMACIHLFRRNISRWYRWQFFYTFYCNPCSMSLKKMDNNILDYVVSNDFIYTYFYIKNCNWTKISSSYKPLDSTSKIVKCVFGKLSTSK